MLPSPYPLQDFPLLRRDQIASKFVGDTASNEGGVLR